MEKIKGHEGLTTNQPISFDDMIGQICDHFGVTDIPGRFGYSTKDILKSRLNKLNTGDDVQIIPVIEADEENLGVLHIVNTPEKEGERPIGYNLYPEQNGEKIRFDTYSGYLGNLTPEEELELAYRIKNGKNRDKILELLEIFRYHVAPGERVKRKHAAEFPETIKEYITLNQPIPFSEAFKQLCILYSIFGDNHHVKSTKQYFREFEDEDIVQFSLLIKGDGTLPNILHLTKINDEKHGYGYTIYPRYTCMEDNGYDFRINIAEGTLGLLTDAEEIEFAKLVLDRGQETLLRRDELYAIKKNLLTRDEAAELKAAKSEKLDEHGDLPWGWPENEPERIRYLHEKYIYGLKSFEDWVEFTKRREEILRITSEEWKQQEIETRAKIKASLPEELRKFFTKFVPTEDTLDAIKKATENGWELVAVTGHDQEDRKRTQLKLQEIVGETPLDLRSDCEWVYTNDAQRVTVDIYFARYGTLEKVREILGQENVG